MHYSRLIQPISSEEMHSIRSSRGCSVFEAHRILRQQRIQAALEELSRRGVDPDSNEALLLDLLVLFNDTGPRG